MRSFVYRHFGLPEVVLQLSDSGIPDPKEKEVLIRVMATAINDYDWSMITGKPRAYRLLYGLKRPRYNTPGMELSGIVERTGPGVSRWQAGDEVFGDISGHGFGTFTEYACVHQDAILEKPRYLSWTNAVALPHAAGLAWQGLRMGRIRAGMKVLINGGGGGVGILAMQMAKSMGCHLTGVDSSIKLNKMLEWGFDEVIDYKTTDFTKTGDTYDLILDCRSSRSVLSLQRSLLKNGSYVTVGGTPGKLIGLLFLGGIFNLMGSTKFRILPLKPNEDMEKILEMFASGSVKPLIEGPYPFEEIPSLVARFGEGKHTGKIVVNVVEQEVSSGIGYRYS